MPSLRKTPSGSYIACFRLGQQQYQRALKTKEPKAAEAAMARIVDRLYRLSTGDLAVPVDVDRGDFVVWGNGVKAANGSGDVTPSFTMLVEDYLAAVKGFKAESTLVTERIHLGNTATLLGEAAELPVNRLQHKNLSEVLQKRMAEVSEVTVKKERQTVVSLFAWAIDQGIISSSPAVGLPTIKADRDRPSFRTREEIEEMLGLGGMDDSEATEIWECLYLTPSEIGEILGLVKERAADEFCHPMFAIIAYTGMRRGEVLRLRWLDVDFRRKLLTARSLKQSRQQRETSREIDLHPELRVPPRQPTDCQQAATSRA